MNEAVDSLNKDSVELIKSILSLFFHLFSNDREGFVTTDRFNALAKPLVDLVRIYKTAPVYHFSLLVLVFTCLT